MLGKTRRHLAFSLLLAATPHAGAADVQFHGFASQAAIWTSDNRMFGSTDDGAGSEFRELGLNGSARLAPSLLLSGQLISRKAGDSDDGEVQLDYGLLDWSPVADEARLMGVRLGRVKISYGLLNETRAVPMTRPGILLPQSIYFERTRNLTMSGDGFEFYGEHRGQFGNLVWEVGRGDLSLADEQTETILLGTQRPGDFDYTLNYFAHLRYERDLLTLAATGVHLDAAYDPGADVLPAGHARFKPLILSAQYALEDWLFTAEYAHRRLEFDGFGPGVDFSTVGQSYYLQAQWMVRPQLEWLARYDVLYQDRDDRQGEDFEAQTGQPAHSRFARDLTLGVLWRPRQYLDLRAEYHNVDGTGWLPQADNPDLDATERRWQMLMLTATLHF